MRSSLRFLAATVIAVVTAWPVHAQLGLIRDAEIETTVGELAAPIFRAAGVNPGSVDVFLVANDDLNAFVAGGQNLFLFTGLLARADTPEQLAGVIAHEAGHIAGGHLVRRRDAVRNARIGQLLASALGAAAAVASGSGELGAAVVAGGATLGGYSIASFSRSEEQSADQAAVTYLDRTGIGADGLAEFFRILDRQQLLTGQRETAYLRTHPFSRDRLAFVERHVAQGGASTGLAPEAQERHTRMVAKLKGFLDLPSRALAEFADREDIAGRYGHAIATFRLNDVAGALREVDALIQAEPANPYFHELKGQILYETGQVQAAVEPYREAVRLAPQAALLQLGLGRALLEAGRPEDAVGALEAVVRAEPRNAFAWRTLGIARGRSGDMGASNLALAEAALLTGEIEDAGLFLSRAEKLVEVGPERRRLQDLERSLERARDVR